MRSIVFLKKVKQAWRTDWPRGMADAERCIPHERQTSVAPRLALRDGKCDVLYSQCEALQRPREVLSLDGNGSILHGLGLQHRVGRVLVRSLVGSVIWFFDMR